MGNAKVLVPTVSVDNWKRLLADPEKHWRTGYSARAIASCWQEATGFPDEIDHVLKASEVFSATSLLFAVPEHKTPLPGGAAASQSDVWCLARCRTGLISITIEGKAKEPFGEKMADWLPKAGVTSGKNERLAYIQKVLGLSAQIPESVRYQLLHRTASAVIEAMTFTAPHAIILIHAFGPNNEAFDDYLAFAKLFGVTGRRDALVRLPDTHGVTLHAGWISGPDRWLSV